MKRSESGAAGWVWRAAADGPVRYSGARFRLECELGAAAERAVLTLSARTRYRLRVNGGVVGEGPARSMPAAREADTYDLASRLRPGVNHIEVEVRHTAFTTFHHLTEPPGFIAWGEIVEATGRRQPLATPGRWQAQAVGVAANAPTISFAQDPVEIVDGRRERDAVWSAPSPAPVGATPLLVPRMIPALTRLPVDAQAVCVATETPVAGMAARVASADGSHSTSGDPHAWAAARGWIYSPREQLVVCSTWWGSYWLNGVPQAKGGDHDMPLRQLLHLSLRPGWNRFCAVGEVIFGYWECCLAWPRAADLEMRLAPTTDAALGIEIAGPLPRQAVPLWRDALVSGEAVEAMAWRVVPADDPLAGSPLRALAWSEASEPRREASLPLRLPGGVSHRLTADLGQLLLGSIACEIEAPPGTVIDVGHAEQATADGRPDYGKAFTVYAADRFIHAGGRQRIETFDPRGFRHLEMRVSGHDAPVTVHALGAVERRYAYVFEGDFACSDPDFNRLWQYGRRTLELCSEDVLTDCPWRERTLYGGDMLAEMGATVALSRDLRLVRRSIEVLLQSADPESGWPPPRAPAAKLPLLVDYPLLTAVAAAWLLRLTGDVPFARRVWPAVRRLAQALAACRGAEGLYVPPAMAFIDHGRRLTAGPTVAFNALAVAAWRAFAAIARAAEAADEAPAFEAHAAALETQLPGAYWDELAGTFRDLPLNGVARETEGSPAIVWPLLFAPATRVLAERVLPALRGMLEAFVPEHEAESVSPYQMFYLLALLRQLGEAELAEATIRRVYARMLASPTGTLWENALPDKSLNHAWSCGVNDYLATAVLGVRLGFDDAGESAAIRIAPCAATLTWARGRVPHPRGEVAVAWERRGDRLRVEVTAPPGVPVAVTPGGPLAALAADVTIG